MEEHLYWQDMVDSGNAALGSPDSRPSARAIFDALDIFGSVMRCCPGSMADLEASEDFVRYDDADDYDPYDFFVDDDDDLDEDVYYDYDDQDAFMEASIMDNDNDNEYDDDDIDTSTFTGRGSERRLRSCGLLYFDDGDDHGGRFLASKKSRYFGADLTLRFSKALRLARLPSIAALVLRDGVGLDMDWERQTLWSREVAMVKLQEDNTSAAVDFLDNAVEFDRRDLRSLQLMGVVNVVRGSVDLGGCARRVRYVMYTSVVAKSMIRRKLTLGGVGT